MIEARMVCKDRKILKYSCLLNTNFIKFNRTKWVEAITAEVAVKKFLLWKMFSSVSPRFSYTIQITLDSNYIEISNIPLKIA